MSSIFPAAQHLVNSNGAFMPIPHKCLTIALRAGAGPWFRGCRDSHGLGETQDLGGQGQNFGASRVEPEAAVPAREESRSHVALEVGDLPADGRLAEAQSGRSVSRASERRYRHERLDRAEMHGSPHHPSPVASTDANKSYPVLEVRIDH
jgi:hypothetical protein